MLVCREGPRGRELCTFVFITLDTRIKQYSYNRAWYTLENCEQEILWLVRITVYGKWEALLHMTSYIYAE